MPPRPSSQLQTLRDLLAGPPSAQRFAEVCELLGRRQRETLDVAIDYANDHMASWPDALRVAPDPWVQELLRGKGARDALRLARTLSLRNKRIKPDGFAHLATAPHLAAIRDVDFSGCGLTLAAWLPLLDSPLLRGIHRLQLSYVKIASDGIVALANHPALATVELLSIGDNPLDAQAVDALTKSPHTTALRDLSLPVSGAPDDALARLLHAPLGRQLRTLDVSYTNASDATLDALATLDLPDLTGLGLHHVAEDTHLETWDRLLGSNCLSHLHRLDLGDNPIGRLLTHWLRHLPPSPLHTLSLASTGLHDDGLDALASAASLANVETLDLSGNVVTLDGLHRLLRSPHLRPLRLELPIAPRQPTLEALAASPFIERLQWLRVSGLDGQGNGIPALLESPFATTALRTFLAAQAETYRWTLRVPEPSVH